MNFISLHSKGRLVLQRPIGDERRITTPPPTVFQKGETPSYLELHEVTKRFGRFTALHQVSFGAERGEFICVLGPSGCGKTTLLRVIAGLEKQEWGQVFLQGKDVSGVSTSRRNVGVVFQSYALFPNLTAFQNISYGLKSRARERHSAQKRVNELLHLVGLKGSESRFPAQLSGGQQQRVALARAMALSPSLLLLDEPLSALDAQVRVMLRSDIKELQRRLNLTTLMVTHDQEEALTMADRIVVMDRGTLVQAGTPLEIYDKPATPFVASFIGTMNFIENATKESGGICRIGPLSLTVGNGFERIPAGQRVTMAIRPEDIMVRETTYSSNTLETRVKDLQFRGSLYRVTLDLPLGNEQFSTIRADIPSQKIRRFGIRENMPLRVEFPEDRIRLYAA